MSFIEESTVSFQFHQKPVMMLLQAPGLQMYMHFCNSTSAGPDAGVRQGGEREGYLVGEQIDDNVSTLRAHARDRVSQVAQWWRSVWHDTLFIDRRRAWNEEQ